VLVHSLYLFGLVDDNLVQQIVPSCHLEAQKQLSANLLLPLSKLSLNLRIKHVRNLRRIVCELDLRCHGEIKCFKHVVSDVSLWLIRLWSLREFMSHDLVRLHNNKFIIRTV
jgi:hypothetical protein